MKTITTKPAFRKYIGYYMMGVSMLHLLVGFIIDPTVTLAIVAAGIFNTAEATPAFFGFFWFQMAGLFMLLTGSFIQHYLQTVPTPIPRRFGYYQLLITVCGCVMEPVSGFYLFIPAALLLIFPSRQCDTSAVHGTLS
ncbi:DUF6463 family protein [Chitinophaga nivalis]|uniref:DUF6463 family protein n=1 Tax=Chitinophaga nivalis TaxID=2991709 RepID=A0ABT3IGS0_9BACT|nr:DUF6463 family protein [Chitinophaga nivalis]MCW3467313.1 DUF6463 family protein [Chitinophaga nivalis]MCW3482995.1 DUF6463 family protein [Chitinophaga nivalis]